MCVLCGTLKLLDFQNLRTDVYNWCVWLLCSFRLCAYTFVAMALTTCKCMCVVALPCIACDSL